MIPITEMYTEGITPQTIRTDETVHYGQYRP